MPNALAITLHAAAAEAASGSGAPALLGDRTYAQLLCNCTALSAGGTLTAVIETSATGDNWTTAATFPDIVTPITLALIVPVCAPQLRVRWTLAGAAPSATFSVTGLAHQLYAVPADLAAHGLPPSTMTRFSLEQQATACLASSDEAAGYVASAYLLPLTAWDTDLRKMVASMAVYDLLSTHGFDPLSGKDSMIEKRQGDAIAWLKRLANGQIRPVGIIDTAPAVRETEAYVASWQSRGWRGSNC